MQRPTAAGYTLIEVMVVAGMIALLASIALPTYEQYVQRAQAGRAARDIATISQAIARFETVNARLPVDLAEIRMAAEKDPWGNFYVYLNLPADEQRFRNGGGAGTPPDSRKDRFNRPVNTDFDLFSVGKDGSTEANLKGDSSLDDVVRAKDGSFIGFARDFE